MDILNKVFDNIMDDDEPNYTSEELKTAITEQTKKVLNQIVQNSGFLHLGLITLNLLKMVQAKTSDIEMTAFGVSQNERREKLNKLQPTAMEQAIMIYNKKYK